MKALARLLAPSIAESLIFQTRADEDVPVRLRGRAAIVTGASRGLGRSIARRLTREGASVALVARDASALQTIADQLEQERPQQDQKIFWRALDVSEEAAVRELVDRVETLLGRVDTLVCNAGVLGPLGPLEEQSWEEWTRTLEINLFGVVLCCRAVLPIMRRQGAGKIIMLSGGGATSPQPRMSAYAASKAAVVRFTETLAEEVKDSGIEVNAVAPGALNTRFLDDLLAAGPARVGDKVYQRARQQQAEGGADLETAAELVAFLASADSDGISGRLISAVWDDWRSLASRRDRLVGSDVYTLRRIVPEDRGWPAR